MASLFIGLIASFETLRGNNRAELASSLCCNRMHVYEIGSRKDHRGMGLISDALPFGRLWYGERNAASNGIDYVKFYSRSIL
jgi:hypothetical protein